MTFLEEKRKSVLIDHSWACLWYFTFKPVRDIFETVLMIRKNPK